jgi:hypothetical protein
VKLAIGTGSAGGVPSGPDRSSTGGGTRATRGRSGFGLGGGTGRAPTVGLDPVSRAAAGAGAGLEPTRAGGFATALTLGFATALAAISAFAVGLWGLAVALVVFLVARLAWALTFAGLAAGLAPPGARFFCAGLEDFVALAMGVPR